MSKRPKKKILLQIGSVFVAIYHLFDRIIITPITKLMLFISSLFKTNNKPLERFLNNKIVLLTLSLVISFAAFYTIDNQTNIILNKSAYILYNQPVNVLYNKEAYVIEGIPATVDITLIGRQSDLYLAKQYPTNGVTVDLTDYKPGTYKNQVRIQYTKIVSSVQYKIDPSIIPLVVISEKVSKATRVKIETIKEDTLDSRYNISGVTLNRDEIYIKASEEQLIEVAVVKAKVDISKIENPTIGTNVLKDIELVAYDENGDRLDNIEIVPKTVDASVIIQSPQKTVALKVIPVGNVVFGKAINAMNLSKEQVTIYGPNDIISGITYIPVKVDVTDLDKNKEYKVTLDKPTGVTYMNVNEVNVKITLDKVVESTLENISVGTRNLKSNYSAQAASKEDSSVNVIIKGTAGAIKQLNKDTVAAYVDLTDLTEGEHIVNVIVTGDDLRLSYTSQRPTVKIIIKKN